MKLRSFVTDSRRSKSSRSAADEHGAARALAAAPPDRHRSLLYAQQHGAASGDYHGPWGPNTRNVQLVNFSYLRSNILLAFRNVETVSTGNLV